MGKLNLKNRLLSLAVETRLKIFNWLCRVMGLPNFHDALQTAIGEIKRLESDVKRLDRKNSLDVRSSLDLVNLDQMGDVVWIRVSDQRMLRQDVFTQIRDYLRQRKADPPVFILTDNTVELKSLTDEDLMKAGLRRMMPSERN